MQRTNENPDYGVSAEELTAPLHPLPERKNPFDDRVDDLIPRRDVLEAAGFYGIYAPAERKQEKMLELADAWFFYGVELKKTVPREGIDVQHALSHIATIQRSYQPKHQHKRAAVAYLFDRWFKKVKWEKRINHR